MTIVSLRQAFGILAEIEYDYMTRKIQELGDMGCGYDPLALRLAYGRGWNPQAHIDALLGMDDDEIGTTHPINWLIESEAERYFA